MFNKPHRDVENEQGIQVSATRIFADYQKNEQAANKIYLDKAIEVQGEISEVKRTRRQTRCGLKSSDPFFGGYARSRRIRPAKLGEQVVVKGFCSGFSSDVVLRDCIIQY
jgi:hypothetical protein